MRLSNATLRDLPAGIRGPRYDRSRLSAGIVHVGVGNFHRAHQTWYMHRLMNEGAAQDWAIVGAGVRPQDEAMRARLAEQDFLTTLIELDPAGRSAEVVGAMIDFVPVTPGHAALIARMAEPDIRIVSLTVTEGGYYRDADGAFDAGHADIMHDAAAEAPRTVFGAMLEAVRRRRAAGSGPFTCLSCDNLPGNGAVLRRTLLGLAGMRDAELARWIEENCSFPDSMVDCIVPATVPTDLGLVAGLGLDDRAPVKHENFRQWVIEDDFCAGRPDWDRAGATFTDDVRGHERMKLRLLNAGHQVVAVPGAVLGLETIADCLRDPEVRALFRKVEREEIAPHVDPVPGLDPARYIDLVERRFSNPEIRDTTQRVGPDAVTHHPYFMVPILRDALDAKAPIEGLALIEALWARMCLGTTADGAEIRSSNPRWEHLRACAQRAGEDAGRWIVESGCYGALSGNARFIAAFGCWQERIRSVGPRGAIREYVG